MRILPFDNDWDSLENMAKENEYPVIDSSFRKKVVDEDSFVYFFKVEESVAGFLVWNKLGPDKHFEEEYAYLDALYVKPNFRNLDIGTKSMAWLEDEAVEKGLKVISFGVDKSNTAVLFYTRLGYLQMDVDDPKYIGFYKKLTQ